ncbi:MAG: HAMP domain-containing histidine kinase [Elusimicrobia bacterium]|nr:HAMP domain-containing histidine kinase [Elusimicrobiota bacterium]
MSIRTRLFIAFGVLVSVVILISAIFIFYTQQTRSLLEKSIYTSTKLSVWKEISVSFERQVRALNYFLVLGDIAEKERFTEQTEIIKDRIKKGAMESGNADFITLYDNFTRLSNQFFRIKEGNIFQFYESRISAPQKSIQKTIESKITDYTGALNLYETTIQKFSRVNSIISIGFGIGAVIIGFFLGLTTFRSIWNPLKGLIMGTVEIGSGNLEYKINVGSGHEIARLANSFNKMVEDLKNMQLQVVQMDRMSSIGQLAGGVAHEINNPLTGVLGQTQLLLEKTPETDPSFSNLQKIEQAAQRCRKIVRALLDFAREKNYVFKEMPLEKIMDETLAFCESEMRSAKIEIIKNIPPDIPGVRVSSSHIQQVFLNVINNAIYAMSHGTDKGAARGKLFITARRNNNSVDISFRDTGIGIKKEDINHIFDPFWTTKDIGKGTGLGLTVSYGIIQKHNGKIVAHSEGEGKGTEILVSLLLK